MPALRVGTGEGGQEASRPGSAHVTSHIYTSVFSSVKGGLLGSPSSILFTCLVIRSFSAHQGDDYSLFLLL